MVHRLPDIWGVVVPGFKVALGFSWMLMEGDGCERGDRKYQEACVAWNSGDR